MAHTNCGNCDWHTRIRQVPDRKTYCERYEKWVGIDDTLDCFEAYNYDRSDEDRRRGGRELRKEEAEAKRQRKNLMWTIIIGFGSIIVAILIAMFSC
jgi:hypothetical protein